MKTSDEIKIVRQELKWSRENRGGGPSRAHEEGYIKALETVLELFKAVESQPDEINKDLVALLGECIANGSRGYVSLGAWFDATCQHIADTLEDIKGVESEETDVLKVMDASLDKITERIQVFAGAMALETICPNGKDPETQYEINAVKAMSAYGTKLLKKWVNQIWMKGE